MTTAIMTTTHDGTKTGFLDLPPELRNEVCRLAFEGSATSISSIHTGRQFITIVKPPAQVTSLLLSNKQMRSEATLLYYSLCQFHAASEGALVAWLKHLKPTCRAAIEHVSVRDYMSRAFLHFPMNLELQHDHRASELVERLGDTDIAFDGSKVALEIWDHKGTEKLWPKDETEE